LSKRLKAKEEIFQLLLSQTSQYFDAIGMIEKMMEIDKLKCLLFSKKELAVFNKIPKPENPYKDDFYCAKNYSEWFKFNLNKQKQLRYYNKYLKEKSEHADNFEAKLHFYLN